jgi:hypothetical protein
MKATELLSQLICRPAGTQLVVVDEETGCRYEVTNSEYEPAGNVTDEPDQFVVYVKELM